MSARSFHPFSWTAVVWGHKPGCRARADSMTAGRPRGKARAIRGKRRIDVGFISGRVLAKQSPGRSRDRQDLENTSNHTNPAEVRFGFNQSTFACFIDRPYRAAFPQASGSCLQGPRSCDKRSNAQETCAFYPVLKNGGLRRIWQVGQSAILLGGPESSRCEDKYREMNGLEWEGRIAGLCKV